MRHAKLSLKSFLLVINISSFLLVLILYFKTLPVFMELAANLAPEELAGIKTKSFYILILYLAFPIASLFFWRKDDNLNKEKVKVEEILKINLNDQEAKKRLIEADNKKNKYMTLIKLFNLSFIWLIIGLFSLLVFSFIKQNISQVLSPL